MCAVTETQLQPEDGTTTKYIIDQIDTTLTIFFIVERTFNMVAFWFWEFWSDGWFIFDTIIVTLSGTSYLYAPTQTSPKPLALSLPPYLDPPLNPFLSLFLNRDGV